MATKPLPVELELPERMNYTPSKLSAWRATKAPGAKFTFAQLRQLAERGLDPETVPSITVRSKTTGKEYWAPLGSPLPVYVIHCPVLGKRRGFTLVITPAGTVETLTKDDQIRKSFFGR